MAYDGEIRLRTQINTKDATSQLVTLENRISKTADKIQGLRAKIDALKDTQKPTQEYQEISSQIEKAKQQLDKYIEKQQEMQSEGKDHGVSWDRLNGKIEEAQNTIKYAKGELQDLVDTGKAFTLGSDTQEYADLARQLEYAENDMTALTMRHEELAARQQRNAIWYDKIKAAASKAFRAIGNIIKSVGQSLNSFTKKLKSIAQKLLPSLSKSSKRTNGIIGSSFKNILKYGLGIRSLYVLVNKLRTAIKEGFTNFYNSNKSFKSSVDELKASALTLKNSLAAAFSPIVEIAIPYIQKLIDYLTSLMDMIGQFTAAITGQKTYTKAVKQTTAALEDETSASNKQLSSLDNLNNMTSSSGSSGTDTSGMFEEAEISDQFKDLAQWLKDMWDISDFTELGARLGEGLKNMLDNIPWDGIKEKARNIGQSLATLINGFIDTDELGYTIGNTLAQGINTGYEFLNSFVHTLDWESLGKFIADSVNGLFENIDWPLIRDTFVTGATGIATAINSFADNLDIEAVSQGISNFFNTIIDTIYAFITTTDWESLGEKLGKTLSDSFCGIDWKKAGETVGKDFEAFFSFVAKTIENIDWWQVGDKVKEFLIGIDWAGVASSFFEAIGAALGGLSSLIGNLIVSALDSVSDFFGDAIESAGGNIALGILIGILTALHNIGQWIIDNIFTPFIEGFKNAFGIHSPSTVMQEMGEYLMEGLLNGIESLVGKLKEKWEDMKKTAKEKWTQTKESVTKIAGDMKTKLSEKADLIKTNWKTTWTNMKTTTSTIFTEMWNKIKSVINSILGGVEKMANGVVNAINTVIRAMNNMSFTIPDWIPEMGGKTFGFSIPTLSNVSIPRLATGTVVPPNKEFLAVLGDNKTEPEVVSPISTMKQAFLEALSESQLLQGSSEKEITLNIPVTLDGREIFRLMQKYDMEYFKRTGRPSFQ